MNLMWGQGFRVASLSEAYQGARRAEDALALAQRALDLCRTYKQRGDEAWVLRHLGELASHSDPSDAQRAEAHYREAVALAENLQMRPLVAHCHLGLGKLYRRTGKREQAHEHLTTAMAMYREMETGFWLEQAEAETRALE